ncbi:hypothetical protein [Brevibacillus laterosporus]|uniref:hypothetical protein n=1 Tax=Brevibacillus laterosporus TaxID=1465 RepID=UPI0020C77970|nr:hypothetical protein [Brevibacillus laterosporus]
MKKRVFKGLIAAMMVFALVPSAQAAPSKSVEAGQQQKVQPHENYLFNFWHNGLEANTLLERCTDKGDSWFYFCGTFNVNQTPSDPQRSGSFSTSVNIIGDNGQIYFLDGIYSMGTTSKQFCLQPGTYTVKYINNAGFPINLLGYFTY